MTTQHEHVHDHSGVQVHVHEPEQSLGPSSAGTVVLDIGPGVGAAIVHTPRDMLDLEIEYRVAGADWAEKHMAVRERLGAGSVQCAAVFGPLPMGDYEFRVRGSRSKQPSLILRIPDSSVATASWPDE
jgi:hypothetical protein